MELKKIVKIFQQEKKIFFLVLLFSLTLGVLFYFVQPHFYKVNLMLNVTRQGTQKTSDYSFDEFYRLQADEKFADTIVRWLESPRIQEDICHQVKQDCSRKIKAKRLSSQYVEIIYFINKPETGKKEAKAIAQVLQNETKKLNLKQKNKNWFFLVVDDPVIKLNHWNIRKILGISVLLGLLIGFWSVLIKYYWKKED